MRYTSDLFKSMAIVLVMAMTAACSHSGPDISISVDADRVARDTPLTNYINRICRTQPEKALRLLDKAEMNHQMRPVKINVFRSMIYINGYNDTKKGLEYAMKAYNDPTIQNDTLPRITVTRMLTAINYTISHFSQACDMAIEGSELANAIGDEESLAYFFQFIAFTKYELGDREAAYSYFDRSIRLYRQMIARQPHWVYHSELIFLMLQEMKYLHGEGRYTDALAKTAPCEQTLQLLSSCPDLPEGLYDKLLAQYLSIASCIFLHSGNREKAEDAYARMMATDYVHSATGQVSPVAYQVLTGRYREALTRIDKEEAAYKEQDSVNTNYIDDVLRAGLAACQGLGYHERANNYYNRILGIKDSLNLRNQRQMALELSEIYETRDKDMQLLKKDELIGRNRIYLFTATVLIALLVMALLVIFRYNRIIQRKNKAVVRNIEEKLLLLQMARQGRENNKDDAESRELFARMDKVIRGHKLFLQPDFSRDVLCSMMDISKAQCSSVVKTCANCSFPTYISRLRLHHSIELMKLHPQYSIEAIAHECCMERANFHRRFVEEFGITPSEFKKTLS